MTFVIAVGAIVVVIASSAMKQGGGKGELEITDLSEQYKEVEEDIVHHLLSKDELKDKEKQDKKAAKEQAKADKKAAKDGSNETTSVVEPRLICCRF